MTPDTASTLRRDVPGGLGCRRLRWGPAIDALDQLEADVASAQAAGRDYPMSAPQIRGPKPVFIVAITDASSSIFRSRSCGV